MSTLPDLHAWYHAQCNGDWEHSHGVRIETTDNPGWHVRIDLAETLLEEHPFAHVRDGDPEDGRDPDNWIDCKVEDCRFVGHGGPDHLDTILRTFIDWAQSLPDWLDTPTRREVVARADAEFRDALGDEIGPETCRHPGCGRLRISYSLLCRAHHYEQIKERPYPDT